MRTRKLLAVAAIVALSTGVPAHADPEPEGEGYNNGDQGLVTWAVDTVAGQVPEFGTAQCEFHQQPVPNTNDMVLVVEGHAHVPPTFDAQGDFVQPVVTWVRCRVQSGSPGNWTTIFDRTEPIGSSQGAWIPRNISGYLHAGRVGFLRICGATTSLWSDDSTSGDINALTCRTP